MLANLRVQVFDAGSSEPLCDAVVALVDGERCVRVESDGQCGYVSSALPSGNEVRVTADHRGYATSEAPASYRFPDEQCPCGPLLAQVTLSLESELASELEFPPAGLGCACESSRRALAAEAAEECLFSLGGRADPDLAERIVVTVDESPLEYRGADGWELADAGHVRLLGAACEAGRGEALVEAWLSCDSGVVPE